MKEMVRSVGRPLQSSRGTFQCDSIRETAYESVAEMMSPEIKKLWRVAPGGGSDWSMSTWLGADVGSPRNYFELLKSGAPKLRDRMLGMLGQLELPPGMMRPELAVRRRRVKGDFGNEVDIHAVNQGRSDRAWDRTVREEVDTVGNKLAHMCIDVCSPSSASADSTLWRGAAVMRLYEALTRMGKSVAITLYAASEKLYPLDDVKHGITSVPIKRYGDTLREEQLATLCTAAFLRCVVVPCESIVRDGRLVALQLGFPISDYQLLCAAAEEDERRGGTVVHVGQAYSREHAHKLLNDFVKQHDRDERVHGMTARELHGRRRRDG